MSIEEIVLEAEERMEKSVTLLADQLRGVRTGRANVGLVDSIRVEYYGSPTPLKQMANLSTPEPQQILIRPFDPSVDRRHRQGDPGQRPGPDARTPTARSSASTSRRSPSSSARSSSAASRTWPRRPASRSATSAATPTSRPTRAGRQDPHRGRPRDLQGRDPVPHQAVREQGQRDGREEVGRDPGSLIAPRLEANEWSRERGAFPRTPLRPHLAPARGDPGRDESQHHR